MYPWYQGRWVRIQIQLADEMISIYNIYGPNERPKPFFQSLVPLLHSDPFLHKVVGGDLNVVANVEEDRSDFGCRSSQRSKTKFLSMVDLADVWREYHPEGREFTHYSHAHNSWSRTCFLQSRKYKYHSYAHLWSFTSQPGFSRCIT